MSSSQVQKANARADAARRRSQKAVENSEREIKEVRSKARAAKKEKDDEAALEVSQLKRLGVRVASSLTSSAALAGAGYVAGYYSEELSKPVREDGKLTRGQGVGILGAVADASLVFVEDSWWELLGKAPAAFAQGIGVAEGVKMGINARLLANEKNDD